MKTLTKKQLDRILKKHSLWLNNNKNEERANLSEADLSEADLGGANLSRANLSEAYLGGADLGGANLSRANLSEAYLGGADLSGANLSGANLSGADLSGANLSGANLSGANLSEANLFRAYLGGANLSGANLSGAYLGGAYLDDCIGLPGIACPEKGSFIGFKKSGGVIIELEILDDAKRSSATTEKCRCSKARVISFTNCDGSALPDIGQIHSDYDENFVYRLGEVVEVDDFDDDRWKECAPGIHFFVTRRKAVEY